MYRPIHSIIRSIGNIHQKQINTHVTKSVYSLQFWHSRRTVNVIRFFFSFLKERDQMFSFLHLRQLIIPLTQLQIRSITLLFKFLIDGTLLFALLIVLILHNHNQSLMCSFVFSLITTTIGIKSVYALFDFDVKTHYQY